MAHTLAQALTVLSSGPSVPFKSGASDAQKKARINQVLERFYAEHTWRGNRVLVDNLTTTAGVLTLAATYSALVALSQPASGGSITIRPMDWEFQSGGTGSHNWDTYGGSLYAIDMGDVSGQRKYRIPGDPDYVDTLTFRGLAKRRFSTLSDSDNVTPDNTEALRMGCLALHFEDAGDYDRAKVEFDAAIRLLNQDLEEYQADAAQFVQLDPTMARISNIM